MHVKCALKPFCQITEKLGGNWVRYINLNTLKFLIYLWTQSAKDFNSDVDQNLLQSILIGTTCITQMCQGDAHYAKKLNQILHSQNHETQDFEIGTPEI